MKKKLNHDFAEGLKGLTAEETTAITGGTGIWTWVGYAVGYICDAAAKLTGS